MRKIATALAGLAIAAGPLFATVSPANAVIHPNNSLPMCESSSPNLCVFSASGTQLTEVNGTPINFHDNGNTWLWNGILYHIGTLNEPSVSPACIGVNNLNNLTNQNCNTGQGIIWGLGSSNGHTVWANRFETQQQQSTEPYVFACSGSTGAVCFTALFPPASGVYERWDFG